MARRSLAHLGSTQRVGVAVGGGAAAPLAVRLRAGLRRRRDRRRRRHRRVQREVPARPGPILYLHLRFYDYVMSRFVIGRNKSIKDRTCQNGTITVAFVSL